MKRSSIGLALAALAALAVGAAMAQEKAATPAPSPAPKASTASAAPATAAPAPATSAPPAKAEGAVEELPPCTECHEDQKAYLKNTHARAWRASHGGKDGNGLCESCHGDGRKHIESGGDKAMISVPRGRVGAGMCQTCHKKTADRSSFWNGVHASTEAVNCLTCHAGHKPAAGQKALLTQDPKPLCESCHKDIASSFTAESFAHRLKEGGMSCVDCHDPHGRTANHALRLTRAGEPVCVSCHGEKRGPFVFPHFTGIAGDCATCHRPHGSPYPHQLARSTVSSQCLECHSTLSSTTLGSQPPSFHDLTLPRYRNCTTCHVAVHGSQRDPQLLR